MYVKILLSVTIWCDEFYRFGNAFANVAFLEINFVHTFEWIFMKPDVLASNRKPVRDFWASAPQNWGPRNLRRSIARWSTNREMSTMGTNQSHVILNIAHKYRTIRRQQPRWWRPQPGFTLQSSLLFAVSCQNGIYCDMPQHIPVMNGSSCDICLMLHFAGQWSEVPDYCNSTSSSSRWSTSAVFSPALATIKQRSAAQWIVK